MIRATSISSNYNLRNKIMWQRAESVMADYPGKKLREVYLILKHQAMKQKMSAKRPRKV